MKVKDLEKFIDNPRVISAEQKRLLAKGLKKYGDLSGVVFNKQLKQLVGGNQRSEAFSPDDEIIYLEKFKEPDEQGTIAFGYIIHNGKKYNYRETMWDRTDHVAASILANKGGGEWDMPKVKDLIVSIDSGAFDLDFTGFTQPELENLFGAFGSISPIEMPELREGDQDGLRTMSFTLSTQQLNSVNSALEKAKSLGEFDLAENQNSNGNAIARICEIFITQNGYS